MPRVSWHASVVDTEIQDALAAALAAAAAVVVGQAASADDLTTHFFKSMALPQIEDYRSFDVPEVYVRSAW